jgi:hypothetical protein
LEHIMQDLRRMDRQAASWAGTCRVAGEPASSWHECCVVDISTLGLALTFENPAPSELRAGRMIFLDFSADGGAVSVRLEGEIRNVAPAIHGGIRVGVEFIRVSEKDYAVSAFLNVMSNTLAAA